MKRGAGKSQANGAAFEDWIAHWNRIAFARGIAHVRKVSPAVKWLPGGRAIVTGDSGCDWSGTLRGGRHLVAESKAHEGQRIGRAAFEPHQIADLDRAVAMGARALALLQLRPQSLALRFAVPWECMPWREVGRGQSVDGAELQEWLIAEGECYLERFAT